jgi:hypothetical protein
MSSFEALPTTRAPHLLAVRCKNCRDRTVGFVTFENLSEHKVSPTEIYERKQSLFDACSKMRCSTCRRLGDVSVSVVCAETGVAIPTGTRSARVKSDPQAKKPAPSRAVQPTASRSEQLLWPSKNAPVAERPRENQKTRSIDGDAAGRFKQATRTSGSKAPRYDEFGNIEAPEFGSRDDYKRDRASWKR